MLQGSERINDEGDVEIKVETVDHRSPAGEKSEPKDEKVEITHVFPSDDKPGTRKVVGEAVGKVVENVQSAKQAISKTQKTE